MADLCNIANDADRSAPVMNVRPLVFVYGTLKRNHYNHEVMKQAKGIHIKDAVTAPEYTMLNLGAFPAVLTRGDTAISGEVYEVDNLDRLDQLEGYPTLYDRIQIQLEGIDKPVWIYVMHEPRYARDVVRSGKWEKRL